MISSNDLLSKMMHSKYEKCTKSALRVNYNCCYLKYYTNTATTTAATATPILLILLLTISAICTYCFLSWISKPRINSTCASEVNRSLESYQ